MSQVLYTLWASICQERDADSFRVICRLDEHKIRSITAKNVIVERAYNKHVDKSSLKKLEDRDSDSIKSIGFEISFLEPEFKETAIQMVKEALDKKIADMQKQVEAIAHAWKNRPKKEPERRDYAS